MKRADSIAGVAFLFNADEPSFGGWYGEPCELAFFRALFAEDTKSTVTSQIMCGDIMIYPFCQEYKGVSRNKADWHNGVQTIVGVTRDLYSATYWDFMDTISLGWHTTDDNLSLFLLGRNTYCIYLPTLPTRLVKKIDERLMKMKAYYGAVIADLGNPVHLRLFEHSLVNDSFVMGGKVYTSKDSEGNPCNLVCRDDRQLKKRLVYLFEDDYYEALPKIPIRKGLSRRGKITQQVILSERKDSHYQNLAESLIEVANADPKGVEFEFVVPEGFEKVLVSKDKLTGYVLNENHATGGHKARLFKKTLGISSTHWRYLRNRIVKALPSAKLHKTRITDHGIQYHAVVPILGRNGKTKQVLTGWIVQSDQNARLTTAYLASKKDQEKYG